MPKITGEINEKNQSIIDVIISPTPIEIILPEDMRKHVFKGLIDTGASNSTISEEVVRKLALSSSGKTPMISASHEVISNVYKIYLGIPKRDYAPIIDENDNLVSVDINIQYAQFITFVCELPNKDNFDVLIGMNVLKNCVLVVTGNMFVLSF